MTLTVKDVVEILGMLAMLVTVVGSWYTFKNEQKNQGETLKKQGETQDKMTSAIQDLALKFGAFLATASAQNVRLDNLEGKVTHLSDLLEDHLLERT